MSSVGMRPWLLVTGDFTPLGGMDRANYALAEYLARRGHEVHLVAHRAWDDLLSLPGVHFHQVRRPRGSHLLGMPLLARSGRQWAQRLSAQGARVVVNGGNCAWSDINWVHYVHAAWAPRQSGSLARKAKVAAAHRYFCKAERTCLRQARWVIANSEHTRAAVIEHLGVPTERARTVYYGIDPQRFRPFTGSERASARAQLGWANDRPAVAFVGALGDLRKGVDTLFAAWRLLAQDRDWDARLIVAGAGSALEFWRAQVASANLTDSVQFLGFCNDVPKILAACDLLVSPTRYEAYGLNVHEALCSGLPALVSASAGVAERYPAHLSELLLPDPEDAGDLAGRLRAWRARRLEYQAAVASLGENLRTRTWSQCAAEFVSVVEEYPAVEPKARSG